jgi:hypothetical protein
MTLLAVLVAGAIIIGGELLSDFNYWMLVISIPAAVVVGSWIEQWDGALGASTMKGLIEDRTGGPKPR